MPFHYFKRVLYQRINGEARRINKDGVIRFDQRRRRARGVAVVSLRDLALNLFD